MKPNLGIAYAVKKKSSKPKMAEGGPVSAKTESRPMPSQKSADSMEVKHNSSDKSPKQDSWSSQPERGQSMRGPKTTPIKHPKMVPSTGFSAKLRSQEDDLMAMKPASPDEQPPKKYYEGGVVSQSKAEDDEVEHPEGLESDNDEMSPAEDEYMADKFAEGGEVEEDHHDSITAAIMAKRDRMHAMIDSGSMDMDHAVKMADGGEVDLDMNAEEHPNDYYHQNEGAALKENYDSDMDDVSQPMDSNEMGDEREDESENKKDMISTIRSRMMSKRQFR